MSTSGDVLHQRSGDSRACARGCKRRTKARKGVYRHTILKPRFACPVPCSDKSPRWQACSARTGCKRSLAIGVVQPEVAAGEIVDGGYATASPTCFLWVPLKGRPLDRHSCTSGWSTSRPGPVVAAAEVDDPELSWERDLRRHPKEEHLRPIVPLVLYQRRRRSRTAREFSELFVEPARSWPGMPRIRPARIRGIPTPYRPYHSRSRLSWRPSPGRF